MIKAIFIDIDNTLLDFNQSAKVAMQTAFTKNHIPFTDDMFPVFQAVNDALWLEIEQGNLTREGLFQVRWNKIFQILHISMDGEKFEPQFIALLKTVAEPVPGAKALLAQLSANYPVYAVTNALHQQQLIRLENAGMLSYISKVFSSELLGVPKPSKAFFDACFAELEGLLPAEVLMIGDSLTADIGGGISYGMQTCWFNYKAEPLPADMHPDFVVNSLEEILSLPL